MRSDADLESAGIDPTDSAAVSTYTMNHSVAARLGHSVEPVFDPLGFDWKTNVAVLSSLAARETFVATLGQMSAAEDPEDPATRPEEARFALLTPDDWHAGTPAGDGSGSHGNDTIAEVA